MANCAVGASLLKLHACTAFVLWFQGMWVSVYLNVGNPIKCNSDWAKSVSTACSTDGVLVAWNYTSLGLEPRGVEWPSETYTRHEWVGVVLFGQALLFAFPYWFWCMWDQKNVVELQPSSFTARILKHSRLAVLLFCELFCWINGIVQSSKVNEYFDYAFTSHGTDVFGWTSKTAESRDDPFIQAFPRRLKCKIKRIGPSGIEQRHSSECWVTISVMIEKIFMVMWFWLVFLSVVTSFALVYHVSVWLLSCFGFFKVVEKKTDQQRRESHNDEEKKPIVMNEVHSFTSAQPPRI